MKSYSSTRVTWFGCLMFSLTAGANASAYEPFVGISTTSMLYCEAGPHVYVNESGCAFDSDYDEKFGHIHDLASLPKDELGMWAVTEVYREGLYELLYIQPYETPTRTVLQTDIPIVSLAIDPTDRTYYGATTEALVRIDPITGEVESIGSLDMDHHWPVLAFDRHGNLYGNAGSGSELVEVDKSTATVNLIGDTQIRLHGLAFHPDSDELHAVSYAYNGGYKMSTIDVADASARELYPTLGRYSGMAFVTVPEPTGSNAVTVMIALYFLVRRQKSCNCER